MRHCYFKLYYKNLEKAGRGDVVNEDGRRRRRRGAEEQRALSGAGLGAVGSRRLRRLDGLVRDARRDAEGSVECRAKGSARGLAICVMSAKLRMEVRGKRQTRGAEVPHGWEEEEDHLPDADARAVKPA